MSLLRGEGGEGRGGVGRGGEGIEGVGTYANQKSPCRELRFNWRDKLPVDICQGEK